MSQQIGSYPPSTGTGAATTPVARDEAGEVGRTAADAGRRVAGSAAEQAGNVTDEVKTQSRDLLGEVRGQVQDQARTGQEKAAGGVRAFAQELRGMADGGGQSGPTSELARQAADRGDRLAEWLGDHEPGDVVEEVRSFARRRPWLFLAGAAAAGVVAGRLTRGAVDSARTDSAHTDSVTGPGPRHAGDEPARPVAGPRPAPRADLDTPVRGPAPGVPAYPTAEVPTPPQGMPPVPPAPAPPVSAPLPPATAQPTPGSPAPPSGTYPPGQTVGEYVEERERGREVPDDRFDDGFGPGNGGSR